MTSTEDSKTNLPWCTINMYWLKEINMKSSTLIVNGTGTIFWWDTRRCRKRTSFFMSVDLIHVFICSLSPSWVWIFTLLLWSPQSFYLLYFVLLRIILDNWLAFQLRYILSKALDIMALVSSVKKKKGANWFSFTYLPNILKELWAARKHNSRALLNVILVLKGGLG